MRVAIALALVASAAIAQSPVSVTARGSISGVVRDEATGKPLSDVQISARRPQGASAAGATDAEGRYTLRGLESGSYLVSAMMRPSGGAPSVASRPVTLQAEQELTAVDIRLPSQCEISGKVVDDNNEPLAGVAVFLVAREYSSGVLRQVFSGAVNTDDQGKYSLGRIGRVVAGRAYLLMAQKRELRLPAISDAPDDPKLRKRVLVPTYYPDGRTPEEAYAVVLRVGERRENMDIRMSKAPSYCVEASLDGPSGPADLRFEIALRQPASGASGGGATYTSSPGGKPGADGKIRLHNSSRIGAGS